MPGVQGFAAIVWCLLLRISHELEETSLICSPPGRPLHFSTSPPCLTWHPPLRPIGMKRRSGQCPRALSLCQSVSGSVLSTSGDLRLDILGKLPSTYTQESDSEKLCRLGPVQVPSCMVLRVNVP